MKRYDWGEFDELEEQEGGGWVHYEDAITIIKELESEVLELQTKVEELERELLFMKWGV